MQSYRRTASAVSVLTALLITGAMVVSCRPAPAYVQHAARAGVFAPAPTGALDARLGYYPIVVPLSTTKPAGIRKEPVYRATPRYATIHVGNGPRSTFYLAVDEPANADYKIYLDKDGDGDLTNDGDGAWAGKQSANGRTMYGLNKYVVRASYGTPAKETSSAPYGLALYRFVGRDDILMFRTSARDGTLMVDGKPRNAMLVENDADGLYDKPLDDAGKPEHGAAPTRPVFLIVDMGGTKTMVDARAPFKLGDRAYEARIAMDGSTVTLARTNRKVAQEPRSQQPPAPLGAGKIAPAFTAEAPGGGTTSLADYRGKVLILDFWATWCGPCQRSMPHLERVYDAVKAQGVAVLGVCSWDDRTAYQQWSQVHKSQYTFPLAFDPAGRAGDKSIATHQYDVSGIPTTFVIGKDGKIAAAIVGYSDGDTRLEQALKNLGVAVPQGTR